MRRTLAALVLGVVLLLGPASAIAAACPRANLPDIEDEVMCPVCKTPLALAQEAPQANRERAFIRERIARCESKVQIKAALATEFGDEVLAMPQSKGFDLTAYLVPVVALLAALVAAAAATIRWRRRRPRTAGPAAAAAPQAARGSTQPSTAARLDRELERYDA